MRNPRESFFEGALLGAIFGFSVGFLTAMLVVAHRVAQVDATWAEVPVEHCEGDR